VCAGRCAALRRAGYCYTAAIVMQQLVCSDVLLLLRLPMLMLLLLFACRPDDDIL